MQDLNLRKSSLAMAICVAISFGLVGCGSGNNDASEDASSTSLSGIAEMRNVTALDKMHWNFIQDDNLTESAALNNDGSTWSTVNLPHSWNQYDAASIAQTSPTSVGYKRGKGWYRLVFDNTGTGATEWLQFDGASVVADVWLNGQKLGQHKGAFTAFRFDVTGKLKAKNNVLVVRTDNSAPLTATDPTAIAPISGDFNMSGGLYRSVSLISTQGLTHLALNEAVTTKDSNGKDIVTYIAGSGAYARTLSINGRTATIAVNARLKNDSRTDGSYTVLAALVDADGKTIKVSQKDGVQIKAGDVAEAAQNLVIDNAHLWQGLADPYLYKLVVELRDSNGASIDRVVQDYGIRIMEFDSSKGFLLNGKSIALRGVNMHQDFQDKAWAISKEDTDLSLSLIREIGANTIRLAHYPHSSYTYQQTDKLGFVIWAEVPFVNQSLTASDCKNSSVVPASFSANAKLQLQELIRQQYNRASIGIWSVGNEVGTNGTCLGVDTVTPVLKELNALANTEDPSRVTTLADNTEKTNTFDPVATTHIPAINTGGITNVWGINRYYGWYYDNQAANLGSEIQELRVRYPKLPIGVSEYGAGSALTHHTDNSFGANVCFFDVSNKSGICYQPEEYANRIHEENYKIIDQPYIWGSYVWNMFDFGSGIRHEGDIGAVNTKGLVTFDRRTKKDAFYFYKANWSSEPVTYITSRRYTERAYSVTTVKVYSNADVTSLSVNGTTVGSKSANECVKKVCNFENVKLSAGTNNIVAQGSYGGGTVSDSVTWNLNSDNATNVYIASGQIETGFTSATGNRYGSDNFFTGGSSFTPVLGAIYGGDPTPITAANGVSANSLNVYQTYRASATPFSYNIPLANGNYTVTLGFIEPSKSTVIGGRVFDVDANGTNVIHGIDILALTGVYRTTITKSFAVSVTNGNLNLSFKPLAGSALVSNIALTKQ